MKSPTSASWKPNCEFYFEDYHRGMDRQECRLLEKFGRGHQWTIALCRSCPVPRIRQANRCPDMVLEAQVSSGFLGMGRRVTVKAFCVRTVQDVPDPIAGCGECNRVIEKWLEGFDPDS